jgi:hypothetical protein
MDQFPGGAAKFLAHLDGGREQLLSEHLLGVSLSARHHSDKIGLGPAGATIGLVHDLSGYSHSLAVSGRYAAVWVE